MKKYLSSYIFILLSVSVLLSSCETLVNDVNPDRLPRSDNRLVVHGYLSPQDTIIQINVYLSSQVVGNGSFSQASGTPLSLQGVSVSLSSQGKTVSLAFDTKNGTYNINAKAMPIVVGETYLLKASFQDKSISSSCTVPKAVAISEVRLDSAASRNFSSNPNFIPPKEYLYRIVWQDPKGEANFYRVAGYNLQIQKVQTAPNKVEERPNLIQIGFRNDSRVGDFFSDERSDGSLFISGTGRANSGFFGGTGTSISTVTNRIELMLLSCEKTYYNYHRAVQTFDDNNPFAEPSLIPTNIQGGLGCFAAYNRSGVVLRK